MDLDPLFRDLAPGITKRRKEFIYAHLNETDTGECLRYPFNEGTTFKAYIAEHGLIAPRRLMCEMAHGPQPKGRRYVVLTCGGDTVTSKCIHPKHLIWARGWSAKAIAEAKELADEF